MKKDLIHYLSGFVTENRYELFKRNLEQRTRYITVALENLYQSHNASAVLRSCDCFGIQDVHVIENSNTFEVSEEVAMGSTKWLTLSRYNGKTNEENTLAAIQRLRADGYRIVATTPHTQDVNLEEFDLSKGKIALFFGSELPGLTKTVLDNADEYMKIPMYGFTESFNISVSCAISLHHLSHQMRGSELNWQLSEGEKEDLMLEWLRNTIKSVELIEKDYHQKQSEQAAAAATK